MNQILMVENKKKKKNKISSGPVEIANIVKFFAIALIIFGLFFIGQGSYAIYKESKGKNTNNLPVVSMERANDTVIIKAKSSYKIENLIYSWDEAEETKIPVEDTYIEEEVFLPIENSILKVRIEEENGRSIKYQKEFIIEGLDISEPTIEITEESTAGSIKITATDETQMAYITYKVNEEEEIRIDKSETEDKTMNYILKLQKGENKVVITAVDTSGNIATLEKTIIVSGKTSMNLKIEGGKLIINAEDPDGIKDIEINLNGVSYAAKDINQKGVRIPLDIVEGTNTVRITITNVNSLVTTGAKEFDYAK